MRDIKVGPEDNGQATILKGLSSGDKVVIAGQYGLQKGSLVQPSAPSSPTTPQTGAQTAPTETGAQNAPAQTGTQNAPAQAAAQNTQAKAP